MRRRRSAAEMQIAAPTLRGVAAMGRAAKIGIVEFDLDATSCCEALYTARGSCYCAFPYRHSRARRLGSDREPAKRIVGRPRNGRIFDDGNSFPRRQKYRFLYTRSISQRFGRSTFAFLRGQAAARESKSRVRAMRDQRGHLA